MSNRIAQALTRLFGQHRIIFWYDSNIELRNEFEMLDLPEVGKLEIDNNEYSIKYRILKKEPKQKFLLYREGPEPENLENWLLDVQLAEGVFRADQLSIWLSELELGVEFTDVIKPHLELLRAAKRRESLKKILTHDDTPELIRMKMLAVCVDSGDSRLDKIMEILLQELSQDSEEKIRLIKRCNLDDFLWSQLNRQFGYKSDEPGIQDFAIELFKSCYAMGIGIQEKSKLTNNALFFLKNWKDSRNFQDSFEILSGKSAEVLGIQQDLEKRDFRELMELDYFRLIDQKIISEIVNNLVSQTVSHDDVSNWIRQRRQSHWHGEFRHLYEVINFATQFVDNLHKTNLTTNSLAEGIKQYCQSWYRLDQLYRKFVYHVHRSGNASLTERLMEQIENFYTNNFLLKIGDQFQSFVDRAENWGDESIIKQDQFFEHWVQPFLHKNNKVCVIISDALRYEIGDELLTIIRQKDRYSAELKPMLSMLPSYTQLGMASLLPNGELSITDNDSGTVLVNGKKSAGTVNRNKILQEAVGNRSRAIKYEDFMQFNRDDSRGLLKDNDVVYIYHNRIDHTGDKLHSEGLAFEAVQEALSDIDNLINRLTGANASNILITADHGFIYQHRILDESDFLSVDASGKEVLYRDRRFVFGKDLTRSKSFHHFTSEQLGLVGEIEIQIPKSINRLRLKGSGSRFVHGGASLQEVVIPVLKVNKKRQSDVRKVEVDILKGASSVITSGQLSVILYQAEPITDKVQQRELQAGIYTESGNLISDLHVLSFDFASDHPRDRELPIRFVLTRDADQVNNQEVILRLREKHSFTSHYKEYKSARYSMRRSFTTDFDF